MEASRFPRRSFLLSSPYGDAFDGALAGFFGAAEHLYANVDNISDDKVTSEVDRQFYSALKPHLNRNFNPHLFEGLFFSLLSEPRDDRHLLYRPSLILKRLIWRSHLIEEQMYQSRERLRAARKKRAIDDDPIEISFSPLYFLRLYLTDPAYTATDAYAHALIRAQIFAGALAFAERSERHHGGSDDDHPFNKLRSLIHFDRVAASIQKIERHWNIGDNVAPANATDFIVMHILASRGLLALRFGKKFLRDRKEWRISRDDFIARQTLTPEAGKTYEFRVLPEVARLPSAAEIINEIDGLPLPIPGTDVVLYRGLRFAEDSGVVMRLSGRTGTGKTSVALGIAVALAPLGTRTVYLSCEEKATDLGHRIQTLIPQNLRRLDSSQKNEPEWFSASYVSGSPEEKYHKVREFLGYITKKFDRHIKQRWETPPGTMPLLIVIDGVHEILSRQGQSDGEQARQLIEECRNTGAVVIILSAKNEQAIPDNLDYLVDFVAGLDFAQAKDSWERPVRIMMIHKTRRQASRVGAHVLHISGRQGLRLSPQVAAQLDQRRDFKWVDARSEYVYDFLLQPQLLASSKVRPSAPLIEIYDRSQILITGIGSTGKSAFGFKLLTTSLVSRSVLERHFNSRRSSASKRVERQSQTSLFEERTERGLFDPVDGQEVVREEDADLATAWFEPVIPGQRKFLVLSFLYEESYYRKLWRKIGPQRRHDALIRDNLPRITFDVHSFSPGYLRPEDFLVIISQKLDEQELQGWPYDGVLLDGLHNVYLQFPYLEQSEMVWPMLFQMLRTRGLTVVTTHTYFTIDPGVEAYRLDLEDVESARRRAAPLLHALVQATDFRIRVSPENWTEAQALHRAFPQQSFDTRVDVLGAIGQPLASEPLYWDRDRGVVYGLAPADRARALKLKRSS